MTRKILLTRGIFALVDDEDYDWLMQYKWQASKGRHTWYATRTVNHPKKNVYIKMHRMILNAKKGDLCDHINGIGTDNRRCNLRIVTNAQNCKNRRKRKNTVSQFKGVTLDKQNNKWVSRIGVNYKIIGLGHFHNEMDAAKAYDEAAKKYYGEYTKLNFSEE